MHIPKQLHIIFSKNLRTRGKEKVSSHLYGCLFFGFVETQKSKKIISIEVYWDKVIDLFLRFLLEWLLECLKQTRRFSLELSQEIFPLTWHEDNFLLDVAKDAFVLVMSQILKELIDMLLVEDNTSFHPRNRLVRFL